LFPNPVTNNVLNIKVENLSSVATLKIYTISGVVCYEGQIQVTETIQIDRAIFKSGIYIVKIYNENFVKTAELIVN
jgi:hypothetical protein